MHTFETERLILREWREDDKDDLFEYAKNPVVGPFAGWKPHENVEESLKIIGHFINGQDCWAVELKESRKIIGSVGLHRQGYDGYLSLGYVLSEPYWGRGYAVEASKKILEYAFNSLGNNIVAATHYPHNQRSKRVIEKLGFTYEGMLRKYSKIFNGEIYDLLCYSMTNEEWQSFKPRALK